MELTNLVELLYTAHRRFATIQVAWHYKYSTQIMEVAEKRWVDMNPPGSVSVLTSPYSRTDRNTQIYVQKDVWWQKPACWRQDQKLQDVSNTTTVLCDGEWWAFDRNSNTLYANILEDKKAFSSSVRLEKGSPPSLQSLVIGVPLLDPSFLLTTHHLEPLTEGTHNGREVIQVRAVYEKGHDHLHEAFFWATADHYDLLVDKEYGILLRYAAVIDNEEYAVSSVDTVVFDVPISKEIFIFKP